MNDTTFDALYASQIQYQSNGTLQSSNSVKAFSALLDLIGPSIVITHSQGGPLGFLLADARPSLVTYLISLEPSGPPFQDRVINTSVETTVTRRWGITNLPVQYSPPVSDPAIDLPFIIARPAQNGFQDCLLQAGTPKILVNLGRSRCWW